MFMYFADVLKTKNALCQNAGLENSTSTLGFVQKVDGNLANVTDVMVKTLIL